MDQSQQDKRIMALDVGTKRIGAAISDPFGLSIRTLGNVTGSGAQQMMAGVVALVGQHSPGVVVVGIPLNMDGSAGPMAKMARKFGKELQKKTGIPVETVDERLTSKEAENLLISVDMRRDKRKKVIDGMAASLILEKYLDRKSTRSFGPSLDNEEPESKPEKEESYEEDN